MSTRPEDRTPDLEPFSKADLAAEEKVQEALIRGEKLANLGRLASTIAHEINNPVFAVMNLLYLAKNQPDCPPPVKEDLTKAEAELTRLSQLTQKTLLSFGEHGNLGLVSIPAILEETLDLFESRLMVNGVKVEKQYLSNNTPVLALSADIKQVCCSLIWNSLDAMAGVGRLKLRVVERSVRGERFARVIVADSGRGIEPSARLHIFGPFFTTKESGGSGLGLWSSRLLIERYGGSLRFRSSTTGERKGTTFIVDLPAVD